LRVDATYQSGLSPSVGWAASSVLRRSRRPFLTERFDFEAEVAVSSARRRYTSRQGRVRGDPRVAAMKRCSARECNAKQHSGPRKELRGHDANWPRGRTVDEVDISTWPSSTLNGEVMQDARTSMMIVERRARRGVLLGLTCLRRATSSRRYTGRVGFARTPPVWLTPGDVIEVFRSRALARSPTRWLPRRTHRRLALAPTRMDTANF